ncbi:MAG: tubulin-like doman-containing protein [Defluviitaleaceae bacterium]|nr:tubulin-like doman-containing protein [Defluviitaleaceae bacterium]
MMKQTTHDNIKQMDISLGGGLGRVSDKARIDTINHPVLVVGLGGTGTDALLRLKYQVSRRFKLPDNPVTKQKKPKPDNIEYISLETNEHDRKKYKGISLDPYTEQVLLSNAGIGTILNNRSTMPDYISQWLNPELTITDGTKGASGNRQAGRLLLFEKINTAIDAIDNKIRNLRIDQENKLLVFLLSGMSGGTGGGMFLDIAYIIRGLMEREYGSKGVDKVEITGYLFTPDIHLAGNHMNIHTEEYIQRNGYAALKELDYWMNLEERAGERFTQKYGTRLEVNSGLAPFNLCHLVSACNIDGVVLKGAYDYCMNVTAENIVNFLALEDKSSGSEFAIQDYYSNLLSNIGTMKSNLPHGIPQASNFVYNIIGASAAALPTEGINAYLAHSLFREMSQMFEAMPDDHDLQQYANSAGLEIGMLGTELARRLPPIKLDYAETDYFSYANVIKTRRVNIDEKLSEQYTNAKRELSESKLLTSSTIDSAKKELKQAFLNPKQGPFFTSKLISSDRSPCILARIDTCQQHLKEKIAQGTEELDALEIVAETRLEEARKAFILSREAKKNAYIEAKIAVYQTRLQRDCFTRLIDVYKDIRTALEQENDKIYAVYTEILGEIKKILHANAGFITSSTPLDSTKSYQWDVIAVEDTAPEIDKAISETGADALVREFSKALLEESARWLNDSQLNISQAISDFIYNQFSSLLARSMSEYIHSRYNGERSIESVIEEEIAPRLYRDAKPIFNLDNTSGMFNFPSYGVVSVPANCPDILRGIEAYQQHALANLRFNIRKSNITDRIFWLNTQNGIPLFAYTPIRVYEELYERTIHTKEGVGRHLVMNDRENWVNLPSPIPEELWGDTFTNPRQKALNDNARQVFQDGLHCGSIKARGERFTCIKTENFDTTKYNFDIKADLKTLYNLLEELTALKENGLTPIDTTLTQSAETFIRCPHLIERIQAENIKYAELDTILNRLQSLLSENDREKDLTEAFLRILTCEAIVKRGAYYIYEKELEEDPWQPFVNLIEQADYPEFAMFNHYKTLTSAQQAILKNKAKFHEETWHEDKLTISLKKWQGTIAVRKNQLDTDMWKWQNGTAMYAFYRNTLMRLSTQISALAE